MADLNTTIDRVDRNLRARSATLLQRRLKAAPASAMRADAASRDEASPARAGPRHPVEAWQDAVALLDRLHAAHAAVLGHAAAAAATSGSSTSGPASRRCWHYEYEMLADARTFERPCNYALVRIVPPRDVEVDDSCARSSSSIRAPATDRASAVSRRTPRSASRCRPAIRSTSSSSTRTRIRARRSPTSSMRKPSSSASSPSAIRDSEKPVLVGNCQGGWAVMMLAASRPDIAGPLRDQRRADVVLGRQRRRQPDALRRRPRGRRLGVAVRERSRRRQVRRRAPGAELREPESREHVLEEVLRPLRQHRHRARALPRVRALVGRLLPVQRPGDPLDRQQPVRRQQALAGRRAARPRAATST